VWRKLQERFVDAVGAAKWRDTRNELELLAGVAVNTMRTRRMAGMRGDRNALR
jgi:hypothetical protein